MTATGELQKLRIDAFQDDAFSVAAEGVSHYILQINPETYKQDLSTSYQQERASNTAGAAHKFVRMNAQTISFDFYLDATGVLDGVTSVPDEIAKFKAVAYDYNGEVHAPNYLQVSWAKQIFKCRLTSLNIEYTLFTPGGTPLRAKLGVSFQQFLSPDELAKLAKKSSPDLTHMRIVRAGDTLPVMCQRIYGSSEYYPQVAAHNGLREFRRLAVGSRLLFPPLEKT